MNEQTNLRCTWRQSWLGCLQDFADADLQRRTWLDPHNQNPHWSYIEFMCSYFDDTLHGEGYGWAIGEGLVTKDEADAVAALHHLLTTHEAPGGDEYPSAEGRLAVGCRGSEAALLKSSLRAQLAAQHEPSDGIDRSGASSSLE
jgi:hypothetical protein